MADDTLQFEVTADVSELKDQLELAQASVQQVADAVSGLSAAMVDAGSAAKASFAASIENAGEALANAKAEIESVKNALDTATTPRSPTPDRQKEAEQEARAFLKALTPIEQGFNTMLRGMLSGRQSFQRAFLAGIQQMAQREIETDAMLLVKKLAIYAAERAGWLANDAAKVAAEQQSNAMSLAGLAIKALKTIAGYAAQAFAGAYQAVVGIPYVGPVIAPGVAAGAEAAVMGAASGIASAAGGMVLDRDQFVMAHAKEMILPAHLSEGLQGMIAAGAGGGGHTFNNSFHLHGGAATPEAIVKALKRAARNNAFVKA